MTNSPKRIIMGTSPDLRDSTNDNGNNIQFNDIFDLEEIQRLQGLFSDATGVASIITYPDGTPITVPSNFSRLCNDIIRKTEKGCANCFKSDAVLGRHCPSGPVVQPCLSGGLWDAGASITVGGKHVANWLIGQVRNEKLDKQRMLKYADEIGANTDDFMEALDEIPVMSVEQFNNVAKTLFAFANELSEKAYTNLQLKKQIADREKATALLQKSEESLSIMLHSIGDGVLSTDNDGLIVNMNPVAEHLCGWKLAEAVGKPLTEVFNILNVETRKPVTNPIKKVMESGQIIGLANHTVLISKNGTEYQIADSAAPIKNMEGIISGVVLVFSDVTEKYKAEAALRESEEKYHLMFANNPQPMWIYDLETLAFLEVNDSAIIHYGYSREEFLSMTLKDIRPIEDISTLLKDVEVTRHTYNLAGEWRHLKKNGEIIFVEITSHLMVYNGRKSRHILVNDITKRKQTEATLHNERLRLRTLIDNLPDSIYSKDLACRKTLANLTNIHSMGAKSEAEVLGKDDFDFYPKEIAEKFLADDQSVIQTGKPVLNREEYAFDENGQKRWLLTSKLPLRDKDGRIIGLIGLGRNITDLKNTTEALRASETLYRSILNASPDAIVVADIDGSIRMASPAALSMFCCELEEQLLGKMLYEFLISEDKDRAQSNNVLMLREYLGAVEYRILRADGSEFFAEINGDIIRDTDGHPSGRVFIIRDITGRKRTEERLRVQADAIEAAIDGLALLNADGNYVYINKSHARIYGYDNATELIGVSWRVLYDTGELQRFDREIMPELSKNGNYLGRAMGKKKDGSTFPQSLSLTVLENGGLICVVRDITEHLQAENDLIIAKEHAEESDRLKSAFLANMSHEIRTPMSGILGFAELLKEPDLTGEQQLKYLSIIEQSGARMLNILNDIVDISKIESGQTKVTVSETNINEQIDFIYNFFKPEVERKGIFLSFRKTLISKEFVIKTDREKLYAILTNLVKNAIKFTKSGFIEFGYEKKGKYLEFFVKDTGVGIRKEQKKLIFERFRQGSELLTRNYEGAGLGLSISKAFVEMLGGRIWVESELGKGSTFYFTIACNAEPEEIVVTNNTTS